MEIAERNQKLAEIKASIVLLEECKEKIVNNDKLSEKDKTSRMGQIDEAIKEFYDKARLTYQATKKEVDEMKYGEVSEEYKEKYANRLKKKGLTDEQLRQKEQAVVITATVEGEGGIRKRHRRTKRTEQRDDEEGFDPNNITKLNNEEELMNKSLANDKKDFERRRHRRTDTMSDTPRYTENNAETVIGEVIKEKKVKPREVSYASVTVEGEKNEKKGSKRVTEKTGEENKQYDFNPMEIPSYIQYDILPLPSNGECYPHKKNRIPVAYLTAADENIIASPNMYRDGKIIDVILERKILDKDIKVDELCQGDRDAIILWLRATGYGTDFPIIARHPETGKEYPVSVKLDTFKYHPFNLKGDENGYFNFTTDSGDVLTFKYLNVKEENDTRDELLGKSTDINNYYMLKYINNFQEVLANADIQDADKKELEDCIADIKDIINIDLTKIDVSQMFINSITTQMTKYTMAVNGNTDKEYIENYIANMRSKDAYAYREFVNDNAPGVNMKITVNVPQSDGGGTFTTFLGIDDYVFGNI